MLNLTSVITLGIAPLERGDRFEFPICDLLDECGQGDVIGSGSFGNDDGIQCCDIQLHIPDRDMIGDIVRILVDGGAPDDTTLTCYEAEDGSDETVAMLADLVDTGTDPSKE